MISVARLALTDFRSYASALIEPGPGFVLLSGDNGAGKTNMLETVSLLTPGRGLRGARRLLVQDAAAELQVVGGLEGHRRPVVRHRRLPGAGRGLGVGLSSAGPDAAEAAGTAPTVGWEAGRDPG